METNPAQDRALEHVATVEATTATIARLKANATTPNRDGLLRASHARLGTSLKLAEVHATLAVAEELAEIRRLIAARVI